MKLETLIIRYKNLGYEPKGLERDLEIASIIKWIYDKYDIYIDVLFCSMKFKGHEKDFHKFTGYKIWKTKEPYSDSHYCDKHFINPFDAKFDAVREIYRAIKFQYH